MTLKARLRAGLVDIAWGIGMFLRRDPMAQRNLNRWRGRWRGIPLDQDRLVIPYRLIPEDEIKRKLDR